MVRAIEVLAPVVFAAGAFAQSEMAPPPILPFPEISVDIQPLKPLDPNSPYASPRDGARHRLNATLERFRADKNVPSALRGIEQSLAADPAYPIAALDLGVICAMAGKWDDAVWAYEEAVGQDPSLNAVVTPELERVRLIAGMEKTPEGANRRRYDEALGRALAKLRGLSPSAALDTLAEVAKSDLKRWEAPALIGGRSGDSGDYNTAVSFLGIARQRSPSAAALPKLDAALAAAQREVDYAKAVASARRFRQEGNWAQCAAQYESAWQIFPARTGNGMEAATAWLLADDTVHATVALNRLRGDSDTALAEKARAMMAALAPVEPKAAQALKDPAPPGPSGNASPTVISALLPDVRTKEMAVLIRDPVTLRADSAPVRIYDALALDVATAMRASAEGMPELAPPSVAGESPQRELAALRLQVAEAPPVPVQTASRATAGRVVREIHITSSPDGAQITAGEESQPVCRTPCILQTSALSEKIRVDARGYSPATQVVRFPPRSNSVDVSLTLEPMRGHVLIGTPGMLVINGLPVNAVTPIEVALLPGLYSFEVRQPDRVAHVTLGVRPDSRVKLPID